MNRQHAQCTTKVHFDLKSFFGFFQRIEKSFEYSGLPGRPCLLRMICELRQNPIDDKHIVGEMITNFFM